MGELGTWMGELGISLGEFRHLYGRVRHLDGQVRHLDGQIRHLDGRVKHLDGRVRRVRHLDGRIGHLDRRVRHFDGRVRHLDRRVGQWLVRSSVWNIFDMLATAAESKTLFAHVSSASLFSCEFGNFVTVIDQSSTITAVSLSSLRCYTTRVEDCQNCSCMYI